MHLSAAKLPQGSSPRRPRRSSQSRAVALDSVPSGSAAHLASSAPLKLATLLLSATILRLFVEDQSFNDFQPRLRRSTDNHVDGDEFTDISGQTELPEARFNFSFQNRGTFQVPGAKWTFRLAWSCLRCVHFVGRYSRSCDSNIGFEPSPKLAFKTLAIMSPR